MQKKPPARIVYPANVPKIIALAESVYEKHQNDGAGSPLHALQDEKWEDIGPTIAAAQALHQDANMLRMQAEARLAERDLLLKPMKRITRASGAFLRALHRYNPKALGNWGYTVDHSPKKKPKKD